MTPTELFVVTRRWLGDEATPYKWTTAELCDYYNYAIDDITSETNYFEEANLAAIIHTTLTAGTPDYAFDSRVLQIRNASIIGETANLTKQTYADLRDLTTTWRYLNSLTSTGISFADAGPDTIDSTSTVDHFTDEGFAAAQYVEIMGSTSNNKTVLTASVTAHQIVLATAETLTIEAAGDQVVLKVLNTGTPIKYCLDYRTGYITLYPCPDSAGVLFIESIRRQLTPLTASNYTTETIPLNSQYHLQLTDGILSKAFLKGSPGTFNMEKSSVHAMLFVGLKDRIKRDLIKLKSQNSTIKPHNGCL